MNRIRELRESKGWTQSRLGKELNCAAMTISRYESEQHEIGGETIIKLCDIFGCTADYLLGRSPVSVSQLPEEEEQLLVAWRRSDSRARDMVAVALAPFRQEDTGKRAM